MSDAPAPFSCCHHCGSPYPPGMSFPKTCSSCAQTHYQNPKPVAVALIPCEHGLLGVIRGIEPGYGQPALPGGFMETNETGEEAAARETQEEVGIELDPKTLKYAGSAFNSRGNLMLFYRADIEPIALPTLVPNRETLGLTVIEPGAQLVFPLHTDAAQGWFERRDAALALSEMAQAIDALEPSASRPRAPGR